MFLARVSALNVIIEALALRHRYLGQLERDVPAAAVLLVGLRFPQEFAFFGAESGPVAGIASSLELTMDK